jgi:hypothetical protein
LTILIWRIRSRVSELTCSPWGFPFKRAKA